MLYNGFLTIHQAHDIISFLIHLQCQATKGIAVFEDFITLFHGTKFEHFIAVMI